MELTEVQTGQIFDRETNQQVDISRANFDCFN